MLPSVLPWVPLPLPGAPNKINVRYFIVKVLRYTGLASNREGKLFCRGRVDIDASSAAIEPDVAVDQSENRVITAEADVFSRQEFCAALADNDIAGKNHLAAKSLYAETFADAVAAVLNAALSFFVSHGLGFFGFGAAGDAFNLHPREFATVTDSAVITFAALVFERDDLFVFALFDNFGRDLSAIADLATVNVHQHFERGRFARLNVQKIDVDCVAFRDAILPTASFDNCVGHKIFPGEKKPRKISQNVPSDKRKGRAFTEPPPAIASIAPT